MLSSDTESLGISSSVLPLLSIVLGLLLVFRNSTEHPILAHIAKSFNAFWEGRKYISAMIAEIRNISRLIWTLVPEPTNADRLNKIIHIKLLLGFMYAVRHALLEEPGLFRDLENLIPNDIEYGLVEEMPLPYQISYRVFHGRWS